MFDAKVFIRTAYLYLFALVGLFILIFGSIGIIKLAITTWIFPQSDVSFISKPVMIGERGIVGEEALLKELETCQTSCNLSDNSKITLIKWFDDYNSWKSEQIDPKTETSHQRQRQLADNLAMIFVALPLYLYHWILIKKDTKNKQ
jgi:hypothetical protein